MKIKVELTFNTPNDIDGVSVVNDLLANIRQLLKKQNEDAYHKYLQLQESGVPQLALPKIISFNADVFHYLFEEAEISVIGD